MPYNAFLLCLFFLCLHEVDAYYRAEWRLLPILRTLDDRRAMRWFIALHIPYFGLFWYASIGNAPAILRDLIAAFAVIHTGLHFFWPRTPLYTFDNPLSRFLIWAAGLCGLYHLVARWLFLHPVLPQAAQ